VAKWLEVEKERTNRKRKDRYELVNLDNHEDKAAA